MKATENTTIYIVCPGGVRTGGPESLHQLCHALRNLGLNAVMAYLGSSEASPVDEYSKYNTPHTHNILDISENIIVFPEIYTYLMSSFNNIQKVIWWLSVDNYYEHVFSLENDISNKMFKLTSPDKGVIHLAQSEYAKQHLLLFSIQEDKVFRVTDYVYPRMTEPVAKKNQVLYNPKKGLEFTQKIIDASDDIRFIPLGADITPDDVNKHFLESKVYIDFGNHPGCDRMPREAAINGCCVITGLKGSAKFYGDVPIDSQYKVEDFDENIPSIISKIHECLADYDAHIKNFVYYREWCMTAEKRMTQEIVKWLGLTEGIFHRGGRV